jgi:cytochrome c553
MLRLFLGRTWFSGFNPAIPAATCQPEFNSAELLFVSLMKCIGGGMFSTRVNIAAGLVIILFSTTAALADDSADDIKQRMGTGDPVAGKIKSALCQSCHGEDGISATSNYPKLAGQYAAYIQKQIKNFKEGSRKDPVMSDMAGTVTNDQDLLDISAYFASQQKMNNAKPVINKLGEARFLTDGNGCVNCHGINGKGLAPNHPMAPVIGGQHKDYLVKQLKDFRSGDRDNEPSGIMPMIASMLSDTDIENIAKYLSGL